jgi:flagellar biosynthesis protein FlhG
MHTTRDWLQSFSSLKSESSEIEQKILPKNCKKISITGGKGGVGKTSIAIKCALNLSSMGYRVLLIDCDANLSNTSIKLGLAPDNRFEKLLSAEISFEECIIQRGNFHLLPACNGSEDLFENKLNFDEVVQDIISSHEDEYDFIFLDCPAGVSKESLVINAVCDHRIIVVMPDRSSITDSYSLIKLLNKRFEIKENHLLVNMYQGEKQYQKVVSTLTETVRNFLGVELLPIGGVHKIDIGGEDFDTFFLAEDKNEMNKNFAKLLYRFAENISGPQSSQWESRTSLLAPEQNVR